MKYHDFQKLGGGSGRILPPHKKNRDVVSVMVHDIATVPSFIITNI